MIWSRLIAALRRPSEESYGEFPNPRNPLTRADLARDAHAYVEQDDGKWLLMFDNRGYDPFVLAGPFDSEPIRGADGEWRVGGELIFTS